MWWLGLVATALGAPTIEMEDDGLVRGSVRVAVSPEVALARISDPRWVTATDGGGTVVDVVGAEGPCTVLDYATDSVVGEVSWTVRQCPVEGGVDQTFLRSGAMKDYQSQWRVTPDGDGVLLTYAVRFEPAMPVPRFVATRAARKGVERMLTTVQAALEL
jgi:hypothetical protein